MEPIAALSALKVKASLLSCRPSFLRAPGLLKIMHAVTTVRARVFSPVGVGTGRSSC